MGRWPWIVALLCVGLLATVAVVGAASTGPATPDASHADARQADGIAAQADREFESLQLRLHVHPSGDVTWTYRYIYPVESEEETAAFRDYAERFEAEETGLYRNFRNQSEALTASAAERLGREMTATDYERAAGIETTPTREVGEVELTYRWTNFARVEDGTVHVGDVFEGGFYLDASQSLVFRAGENLTFESVAPEDTASTAPVEDRETVTWSGEQRFPDSHPRATLAIQDDGGSSSADVESDDRTNAMSGPMLLGGGILLLVLTLLVVAVARGDLPVPDQIGAPDSDGPPASEARQEPAPDDSGAAVEAEEESAATDDAEADTEALSDEQRVRALLEEHDGRMKQTAIVEETEWSKSKVSMLLSDMEEEAIISKIQVGRENIIALQGNEPEAASSPFDDSE